MAPVNYLHRFHSLERLLLGLQPLWRPQPYKERWPEWCAGHPQLTAALLALTEAELSRLQQDDTALWRWLAAYVPPFAEVAPLVALPEAAGDTTAATPHLDWGVPGRKWAQVEAFAAAVHDSGAPVLEWCGGKGHLGRLLARRWRQPVTTLDHDPALCRAGERLAQRAQVPQRFVVTDVLGPALAPLQGQHAVALHACGELHRTLLRRAVAEGAPALDLAPCCYHLGGGEDYHPLHADTALRLSRDDLRLAVTATATAAAREVRRRDREMAWKLGYLALRAAQCQDAGYHPLRPIDKGWLQAGFSGFCQELAARDGLQLPAAVGWDGYERQGWQRQGEVMRLSLLRHAVRRALELWLVLDAALYLQDHGYTVRVQTFCPAPLTPRNILLSARR